MNRPRAHAGIRPQLRLSCSPSRGLQSQVVVDSADTGRRFRSDADRLPFGFRAGDAPKAYHAAIDGHVQRIRMRPRLRLQICQQSIANRRIGERILQLYWRARYHLNYIRSAHDPHESAVLYDRDPLDRVSFQPDGDFVKWRFWARRDDILRHDIG